LTEGRTTEALRVSATVYDQIVKYKEENALADLRTAADQIFFVKLAQVTDAVNLSKEDVLLSPYELLLKYWKNDKVIDGLIKAARLRKIEKENERLDLINEKLRNPHIDRVIEEIEVYCCPACQDKFKSAFDVTSHFKANHEQEQAGVIGNVCPFCLTEKAFETKGDLGTHIKAYHQEKPAIQPPKSPIPPLEVRETIVTKEVEVKSHVCYCRQSFKTEFEMMQHATKCNWLAAYAAKQRVTA
jgi:hypothetical protein